MACLLLGQAVMTRKWRYQLWPWWGAGAAGAVAILISNNLKHIYTGKQTYTHLKIHKKHKIWGLGTRKWRYQLWPRWCYSHLRAMKMRRKSRREMESSLTLTLWTFKHTNTYTGKHVYTHLQMHKGQRGWETWPCHCEHKHIQANTCILLFKYKQKHKQRYEGMRTDMDNIDPDTQLFSQPWPWTSSTVAMQPLCVWECSTAILVFLQGLISDHISIYQCGCGGGCCKWGKMNDVKR